ETGDINYTARYYSQALEKLKESKEILLKSGNPMASMMLDTIKEEEREIKNIATLSKLAELYEKAFESLSNGKGEEALKISDQINKLIEKLEKSEPVPYLYGVSVSYASAASALVDVVERDVSYLGVLDRLISQFSFPLKTMSEAISNIDIAKIRVDDDNPQMSFSYLKELENELTYLKKAIEILPTFLADKENHKTRIEAIVQYLRSIIAENKIYIFADNNIVLDLILRARAHYFAKKAEQKIKDLKGSEELKEAIKRRIMETKSAGVLTETNLVSLGLQSAYSKTVRDVIEQILFFYSQIEKPPEFILESVKKQFEEMVEFKELLSLIELDNKELLALKQDTSIKGHEINWAFVERRDCFIPATKKMFETIEAVLLGELAADLGKRTEAVNYYTKGKKLLYDVSDILSKVVRYIDDNKELPNLIYTLALFTQENLNAIRDRRKRKEVPYKEIIGILDYLILNL
ncbi:MAG: hypothetical protein ACTSQE_15795, partial [Candidatus Heimdallarchaeaceae archaeon]